MNLVELIIFIIIVLLPSVLLWIYINKADKDKEPKKVLIKLFSGGVLAAIAVIIISLLIEVLWPGFIEYQTSSSIKRFVYIFLGIALIEELLKYLAMKIFGWKDKNLNYTYDIILYSMIIALGFATFENILYAIDGDFTSAILRAFTAVPGHVIDGAFMGYFLCQAKLAEVKKNNNEKKKQLMLAIIIPIFSHTIYDYLAMSSDSIIVLIIFIIFVVIEYIISIRLIRKMSKNSKSLVISNSYCAYCGTLIKNNFCPNCGNAREKEKNIDF